MPTLSEEHISNYSTKQLYELVIDIEKYPEFLPWCLGARIVSQVDNVIVAQLTIGFNLFSESYTSRVELIPPEGTNTACSIIVSLVEGPFKYLNNSWQFLPTILNEGSKTSFHLDFEFRPSIFKNIMSDVFEHAVKKMINAFEERAKIIYNVRDNI